MGRAVVYANVYGPIGTAPMMPFHFRYVLAPRSLWGESRLLWSWGERSLWWDGSGYSPSGYSSSDVDQWPYSVIGFGARPRP